MTLIHVVNKDYPLTLDRVTDELNFKCEKIFTKNEYDPESG